jgi:hypothetical protein
VTGHSAIHMRSVGGRRFGRNGATRVRVSSVGRRSVFLVGRAKIASRPPPAGTPAGAPRPGCNAAEIFCTGFQSRDLHF